MDLPDFSSFVNEFLEEAEEHLQTLNSNLLGIEQNLASGTFSKEKVDSLFRAAHTVKGLAGMMEFEKVEMLCHKMEDIFGELRQGSLGIAPPIIDTLFIAVDLLAKLISEVKGKRTDQGIVITEVVAKLERVLKRQTEMPAVSPPPTATKNTDEVETAPPPPAITGSAETDLAHINLIGNDFDVSSYNLNEKERSILSDSINAGLWIYEVTKEFVGGTSAERLERLLIFKQIEELGMLISAVPPIDEIPEMGGMVNCRILFSSEMPTENVRDEFMDPVRTVVKGEKRKSGFSPLLSAGEPEHSGEEKTLAEVLGNIDESLVAEFLRNSTQALDQIDLALLELERDPTNLDLISDIHKSFRTLKGTSAIFGFSKLAILGGKLETLFENIRTERITAGDGVFDCVSGCMITGKELIDEIRTGKDKGISVDKIVVKLTNLLGQARKKSSELDALMNMSLMDGTTIARLNIEEKNIIADEYEKAIPIYEINIGFPENVIELGYEPISAVPILEKIGNILVSIPIIEKVPDIAGFDEKKFGMSFRFLLSTVISPAEMLKRLDALPRFFAISVKEVLNKKGFASLEPLSASRPKKEVAPVEHPIPATSPVFLPHQQPVQKQFSISKSESLAAEAEKKLKEKGANTIRVDIGRLDKLLNLIGELVIDRTRLDQIGVQIKKSLPHDPVAAQLAQTSQLFHRHMNEIQDMVMSVRMVPIGNAFGKFPRIVRDLAKSLGKNVNLVTSGEETELDKTLIEEISDPLVHLIRNAIDHGIEPPKERIANDKPGIGTVELKAFHEGDSIIIEISDDGRGMDMEGIRRQAVIRGLMDPDETNLTDKDILQFIFEPGFSTAQTPTMVSGRGVGMDVVKRNITKLKGLIDIHSEMGKGSRITIRLPLTLAIVPTLLVGVRDETFAIPLSSVVESIRISPSEIREVQGREMITLRDSVMTLARLDQIFELDRKKRKSAPHSSAPLPLAEGNAARREKETRKKRNSLFVVVIGLAEKRLGIVVNELKNQQEVVIKSLGSILKDTPGISGATIMGDGQVALILDAGQIIEEAGRRDRLKPSPKAVS